MSLYNLSEVRDYMPSNSHMHLGHSTETRNYVPTHLLTSTATTYHYSMLTKSEKLACSLTPPNPHTLQTPSMKSKTCPLAPTDLCSINKFPWGLKLDYNQLTKVPKQKVTTATNLQANSHFLYNLISNSTQYLAKPKEAKSTRNTKLKHIFNTEELIQK